MFKNLKFKIQSKFKIQNSKLPLLPKILTIFFIIVFILQIICIFFLLTAPVASQAAEPIKFTPEVTGIDYGFDANDASTGNIARAIRGIYKYAIGIVGILAAVILMIAGILWLTAGGNASQITEAKAWITASLTGLVVALCSFFLLATVNPNLVELKTTGIEDVAGNQFKRDNSVLEEGEPCKESTPPFCTSGLTCKNGICTVDKSTQGAGHLSTEYRWLPIVDCSGIGKNNYSNTYCADRTTNTSYKCCGLFKANESTPAYTSTVTNKPAGAKSTATIGCCLIGEKEGMLWGRKIVYRQCDDTNSKSSCTTLEKNMSTSFTQGKKCKKMTINKKIEYSCK